MVSLVTRRLGDLFRHPLGLALLIVLLVVPFFTSTLYQEHLFSEVDVSVESIEIIGELPGKQLILQINVSLENLRNVLDISILELHYDLVIMNSGIMLGDGRLLDVYQGYQDPTLFSIVSAFQVYNVSRFLNFLVNEASSTGILIEGRLTYQILGLTSSMAFSFVFQSARQQNLSLIQEIRLIQFHPISPGTDFSLSVGLVNNLPLNMTLYDASFVIINNASNATNLGTVRLIQGGPISLGLNVFNGTLRTQNELITGFVQAFVTGGGINATIDELSLKLHILEENVTLVTTYQLYMDTSEDIPQRFESIDFNVTTQSFELTYRFDSSVFWGFNITFISFNIYYQFLNETSPRVIGTGKSTQSVFVPYNATVLIPIAVKIPLDLWDDLIREYLRPGPFLIDIRDGLTIITAYSDLNVTVHFEQLAIDVG